MHIQYVLAIIVVNFMVQIINLRLRETHVCEVSGGVDGICTRHCRIPPTHALYITSGYFHSSSILQITSDVSLINPLIYFCLYLPLCKMNMVVTDLSDSLRC